MLDFPAAITCADDLADARRLLAIALVDVAEAAMETGQPLPVPNPQVRDSEMDIEEPIYLHLRAEPGSWVGPKGARVGGAALAAALADALVVGEPKEPKPGLRERAMRRVSEAAMAHIIPGMGRR